MVVALFLYYICTHICVYLRLHAYFAHTAEKKRHILKCAFRPRDTSTRLRQYYFLMQVAALLLIFYYLRCVFVNYYYMRNWLYFVCVCAWSILHKYIPYFVNIYGISFSGCSISMSKVCIGLCAFAYTAVRCGFCVFSQVFYLWLAVITVAGRGKITSKCELNADSN